MTDQELQELANEAAAVDLENAPAPLPGTTEEIPKAPVDYNDQCLDLINFTSDMFVPLYPRLADVYTREVKNKLAEGWGPVMQKYNLSLDIIFGKYGCWFGATMATIPLIMPTYQAIKQSGLDRIHEAVSQE